MVILEDLRAFWSFLRFRLYFNHLDVLEYFGHFRGFEGFFFLAHSSSFRGILVILEILGLFWSF